MRVFTMANARRLARRDFKALSGKELADLIYRARAGTISGEVLSGHTVPSNPARQAVLVRAYVRAVELMARHET